MATLSLLAHRPGMLWKHGGKSVCDLQTSRCPLGHRLSSLALTREVEAGVGSVLLPIDAKESVPMVH